MHERETCVSGQGFVGIPLSAQFAKQGGTADKVLFVLGRNSVEDFFIPRQVEEIFMLLTKRWRLFS